MKQDIFEIQTTDTFAGEANYCWVHTHRFAMPLNASERSIVRKAKALEGTTAIRHTKTSFGDEIWLDYHNCCVRSFIMYIDTIETEEKE